MVAHWGWGNHSKLDEDTDWLKVQIVVKVVGKVIVGDKVTDKR